MPRRPWARPASRHITLGGGTGASFSATQVTVNFTYNYLILGPIVSLATGGTWASSITITARSTMRREISRHLRAETPPMNRTMRTVVVVLLALSMAGLASFAVYRAVQRIPVREVEVAKVEAVVAARRGAGRDAAHQGPREAGGMAREQPGARFLHIDRRRRRPRRHCVDRRERADHRVQACKSREAGAGLPPTIPPGMRAMSVKVNEVIGVAGFVVPGTRVDVLATVTENKEPITRTVVSNALVLAAGTRYDQDAPRKDGKPIPTTVVTLVVLPSDAERISLAATEGKVMLALRNPLDTQPTETQGVRLANLLAAPAKPPVEKKVRGVKMVVPAAPRAGPRGPAAVHRRSHPRSQADDRRGEEVADPR